MRHVENGRRKGALAEGPKVRLLLAALLVAGSPLGRLQGTGTTSSTVFGPEDFVRHSSPSEVYTRNFSVSNTSGAFTLCLDNGGSRNQYGFATSAVIKLNDQQVVAPGDFPGPAPAIAKSVAMRSSNRLSIELRDNPGTGFSLSILRGSGSGCVVNQAPVAKAGPDQTVAVGATVQLDGSQSSDADGNPLTYQWTLLIKPLGSVAALSNPKAAKPTFKADKAGPYLLQLVVNDGKVNSEPDLVAVSTPNSKPVANAGDDRSVPLSQPVTLNGSGSSDADNDPLVFLWTFSAKPAGSNAYLSNFISKTPVFTPDKPGLYVVQLIVSDLKSASAPDTVNITAGAANRPPNANAGPNQNVSTGATVLLTGAASSDPDGDALRYSWVFTVQPGGSSATLNGANTATPSFVAGVAGTYTVRLTVDDGRGGSASAAVTITATTATPTNRPPTITSTPVTTATLLQPYTYTVTAADADNDTLAFALTAAPQGMTIGAATGIIQWTPPGTGNLNVAVQVSDGHGGTAAQPFIIAVAVQPNSPPALAAIGNRTIPLGATLRIHLAADDPNQQDALAFSLPAGPAGASLHPSPIVEWTPTSAQLGASSFTARVQDAAGASDTETFSVTVVNANLPPQFDAQPDASVVSGAPFGRSLNATDPNAGDVLHYTLLSGPAGMTLTGNQLSWTPGANQLGVHSVKVEVADNGSLTDTALFNITVGTAAVGRPPVAVDDRYAVRRQQALSVPAPGVLANDSDPDGDSLNAQLVAPPGKGTLNLASNGSFTYTPAQPAAGSNEPKLKFAYQDSNTAIIATLTQPVVVDLDKDGSPEIVFNAMGPFGTCRLIALHGSNGSVAFSVNAFQPAATPPIVLCDPYSELAAGDIDGDGFPEIIAVDGFDGSNPATDIFRRQLIAFNHDGTRKWTSQDVVDDPLIDTTSGFTRPTIADLDGDGIPEIVVAYSARGPQTPAGVSSEDYVTVFDNQGHIRWTARGGGSNGSDIAPLVVDIDLDGKPEILASDDVYDYQGNRLWSAAACLTCQPRAVDVVAANLDDDPFPEIIYLDSFGDISVYEHTGVKKWGPLDITGLSGSVALAVGDADGDGKPEILATAGSNIVVISRDGASQRLIPIPLSDNFATGNVTIFDLNGDGKPELIHNATTGPFDAGAVHGAVNIFDGQTGTHLYAIKASRDSGRDSAHGPIVADVDGDGDAEIVTGGWNERELLHVFEAKTGPWAKARPVYNEHAYHVTNVNSDGTIPAHEAINWLTPGLNNYRVNIPLPEERTGTRDQFTYRAGDGALSSNTASVILDLLPPNTAPSILSQPPLAAAVNIQYLYAVRAVDPDAGETLVFSLGKAPSGMTIDAATGLIRWTPAAGVTGDFVVALKVTDSQGQSDFQGFTITVGPPATVPGVTGQPLAAAQTALTAAGLTPGAVSQSPSATVAVGVVISQEPAAQAVVASRSAVDLVVSSGPAAVPVPNVVGKTETAAQTLLASFGFTAGITRVFSNATPRGEVTAQNPAPGTPLPPGPVAITVSAGNGLTLRLQRSLTTADVPIPFTVAAYDVNGVESAAPPLNYAVTAVPSLMLGTLPTVSGATIVPGAGTRGSFRVTATDPATSHSVSADFAVTYPRQAGQPSMMEDYAKLTEAMGDIDNLIRQGQAALAANDTALMRSLLQQMVTRWRQVDTDALKFAVPLALESGFPATRSQLSQLGLTLTADDRLIKEFLDDADGDLKAWTDALLAPATPLAQLNAAADRFNTRIARLRGLTISEAGAINAQASYAVLVSRRLPALYSALMDEVGRSLGVPAPTRPFGTLAAGRVTRQSTLAELATTQVMQFVIEKMMEPIDNAKKFTTDVLMQGAWAGAAIVFAQHVRAFVQGQDLAAVVAGASLSFRLFGAPFSMIEGEIETEKADLNTVILIGPDIAAPVAPWIDKFKNGMKFRQILNPVANDGKYKNHDQIVQDLKGFKQALRDLQGATQDVVNAIGNAFQTATGTDHGCIFSNSPTCGELQYPDGFNTVYSYTPPPGFQCYSGLPVPIVFIVYNAVSGTMYFDTPPFFPAQPTGPTTCR